MLTHSLIQMGIEVVPEVPEVIIFEDVDVLVWVGSTYGEGSLLISCRVSSNSSKMADHSVSMVMLSNNLTNLQRYSL